MVELGELACIADWPILTFAEHSLHARDDAYSHFVLREARQLPRPSNGITEYSKVPKLVV